MLLVLEGLDGAGKSTQISLLKSHYEERGENVKILHFPRFEAPVFGDLIARFLRGDLGGINEVHPMLTALLFAGDRRDAAPILNRWLDEGCCVILDRYIFSNIAFQCAKLNDIDLSNELRNWILDTEYNKFCIPKPHFNLFLDVPLEFVDDKLKNQREGVDREYLNGKRDIHEENIQFQTRVREIYLKECQANNLLRVDCSDKQGKILPAAEIFKLIKDEIS